jgi:hypothetical protein
MNELAMYFAPRRVDDGYLEVLIVAQASIPKVLGQNSAMCDGVGIGLKFDPDSVSEGNAVDHIEEKLRHRITSDTPIRCLTNRSGMKCSYRAGALRCVWALNQPSPRNKVRSDAATCRCRLRSAPGGNDRA